MMEKIVADLTIVNSSLKIYFHLTSVVLAMLLC